MFPHSFFMLIGQKHRGFTFTGDFHNLKRHFRLQALEQQIGHNAVARTNYIGDGTGTAFNQILCVTQPNIGSM